ncbi:MAG: DUF2203 family protein [bacterium]
MNLYDKDDGFKKFTLEEANALLPEVIQRTEKAVQLLEKVKQTYDAERSNDPDRAEAEFDAECAHILDRWSREIVALGAYPKGYFTVDFKSPLPDTLFCWTLGERVISHTHKIFESYKDRVPIQDIPSLGFENSLN